MIYSVVGVPLRQGCLDWITSDEPCEDEILRALSAINSPTLIGGLATNEG
jgi:hypothetical protein